MPRSAADVVNDIHNSLRASQRSAETYTWRKFYVLNQIERMKDARYGALEKEAKAKGIVIAYGNAVVVCAWDTDFAPA